MAKVHDDANAKGIELPSLFSEIDEESGLPKLLMHTNDSSNSMASTLGELIPHNDREKKNSVSQLLSIMVSADQSAQTAPVEW